MIEENKGEAVAVEPGGVGFCMATRNGKNEHFFVEPCNEYGLVVFHSREAVDLFVERLKKYRDLTYGEWKGEPL